MTKHIHYDAIIAWANGAKIQAHVSGDFWEDLNQNRIIWNKDCKYRVKPTKTIQIRPYMTCAKTIRVWTSDWERTQEKTQQDLHFSKWLGPVEERTFDV